jgi:hypothetical protein
MLGHLGNVLGLDKVGGVHKGWWSRMGGCHNGPKNRVIKKTRSSNHNKCFETSESGTSPMPKIKTSQRLRSPQGRR